MFEYAIDILRMCRDENRVSLHNKIYKIIDKQQVKDIILELSEAIKILKREKVKCDSTDCLFNTNRVCGGTEIPIEIDINAGCKHYKLRKY